MIDIKIRKVQPPLNEAPLRSDGRFTEAWAGFLQNLSDMLNAMQGGAFVDLSASGIVSGDGFVAWAAAPPPIGDVTPNTGAFSELIVSGGYSYVTRNMDGIAPTAGAGGAIGWNYDENAEVDHFNVVTVLTPGWSHMWWQCRAVGSPRFLAGLDATGLLEAAAFRVGDVGPTWTTGHGAPSSVEQVGSLYSRVDGGVGTTLYVSRGATNWLPVAGV